MCKNLGLPNLNKVRIKLPGFGKNSIKTLGSFRSQMDWWFYFYLTDIYVVDDYSKSCSKEYYIYIN